MTARSDPQWQRRELGDFARGYSGMASISRPVGDKNYFRTPRPTATVRCLSLGLPAFAGQQLQPQVYKASKSRVCQPSRPSRTAAAEKRAPRLAAALRSSARSATSSGSRNGPYSRSVRQRPGTLGPDIFLRVRVPDRDSNQRPKLYDPLILKSFSGGEGGIRTHVPELPDHPISSRRRYDHFGTSPARQFASAVF